MFVVARDEVIRIRHECKGGIEKSVPRFTDWHHELAEGFFLTKISFF